MTQFNKYKFIYDLKKDIENDILSKVDVKEENDNDLFEQVQEYIDAEIDNSCIYYADCFNIIKSLNFISFKPEDNICGLEINSVSQAAYVALMELIDEEINIDELINK